jgi:hypothetical protein
MNYLKQAFKLLDNFPTSSPAEQRRRIKTVGKMLRAAEKNSHVATLALRETDQLRKQLAYFFIESGRVSSGLKQIQSIVLDYERSISNLHDEAAFQLAEASIASFKSNMPGKGMTFVQRSLCHSGAGGKISKTLLTALSLAQSQQQKQK